MNEETTIEGDDIDDVDETPVRDTKYLVAALLVMVAKGDGEISGQESAEMMALMETHFDVPGGESLALLRQAIDDFAEIDDMDSLLGGLGASLAAEEQEDIAVMLLKVVAADGEKDAAEMEKLRAAAATISIPDDVMHRAFDRYFEETQVLPEEEELPGEDE